MTEVKEPRHLQGDAIFFAFSSFASSSSSSSSSLSSSYPFSHHFPSFQPFLLCPPSSVSPPPLSLLFVCLFFRHRWRNREELLHCSRVRVLLVEIRQSDWDANELRVIMTE